MFSKEDLIAFLKISFIIKVFRLYCRSDCSQFPSYLYFYLFFFTNSCIQFFSNNSINQYGIFIFFKYLSEPCLKKSFVIFFILSFFRLAEEHSMENPAYNKDHRFTDQLYNTQSSQNEVYSEIKANFVSLNSFDDIISFAFCNTTYAFVFGLL